MEASEGQPWVLFSGVAQTVAQEACWEESKAVMMAKR